ncbi:MAG: DNA-directed RNA polymerase subunit omega [Anaerotignaceae bacterium]
MLRPSYSDLLEEINKGAEGEDVVGSRYTIVIAAAKRARQLVDHAVPLTNKIKIDKPVSIAVHELYEGKIQIVQRGALDDEMVEAGQPLDMDETDVE